MQWAKHMKRQEMRIRDERSTNVEAWYDRYENRARAPEAGNCEECPQFAIVAATSGVCLQMVLASTCKATSPVPPRSDTPSFEGTLWTKNGNCMPPVMTGTSMSQVAIWSHRRLPHLVMEGGLPTPPPSHGDGSGLPTPSPRPGDHSGTLGLGYFFLHMMVKVGL